MSSFLVIKLKLLRRISFSVDICIPQFIWCLKCTAYSVKRNSEKITMRGTNAIIPPKKKKKTSYKTKSVQTNYEGLENTDFPRKGAGVDRSPLVPEAVKYTSFLHLRASFRCFSRTISVSSFSSSSARRFRKELWVTGSKWASNLGCD